MGGVGIQPSNSTFNIMTKAALLTDMTLSDFSGRRENLSGANLKAPIASMHNVKAVLFIASKAKRVWRPIFSGYGMHLRN
jgi:hypothetical protein